MSFLSTKYFKHINLKHKMASLAKEMHGNFEVKEMDDKGDESLVLMEGSEIDLKKFTDFF